MTRKLITELAARMSSIKKNTSDRSSDRSQVIPEDSMSSINGKLVSPNQFYPDYWQSESEGQSDEIAELRLSLKGTQSELLKLNQLLEEMKSNAEKQAKLLKRLFFITMSSVIGLNGLLFWFDLSSNSQPEQTVIERRLD